MPTSIGVVALVFILFTVLQEIIFKLIDYFAEKKIFKEAPENCDDAIALSLKIGMAVAMADGVLDDTTKEKLRNWINNRPIEPFNEKEKFRNQIDKDAKKEPQAVAGKEHLKQLISRLNEIGEKSIKYDVVKLCSDVLAADNGVANAEELAPAMKVATGLGLDEKESDELCDRIIIELNKRYLKIDPSPNENGVKKSLEESLDEIYARWEFRRDDSSPDAKRLMAVVTATIQRNEKNI